MSQNTSVSYRNNLLRLIPAADLQGLLPYLKLVNLDERQYLETAYEPIKHVYFIETGLGSIVAKADDKNEIEIGLLGFEGMTGASLVLGDTVSPFHCYMQMKGTAYRIDATDFLLYLKSTPSMMRIMHQYGRILWIQTGYTALSFAKMRLEARLARWLLMVHDRTNGDVYQITHDFLAVMLGVRRPGVTVAMQLLEGKGAIRSRRRTVFIRDRKLLESLAAPVYGLAEKEYERLLGLPLMRSNWSTLPDAEPDASVWEDAIVVGSK